MEKITYECECCKKDYDIQNGIIAEIKNNKIITDSCTPFTKLVQLCGECASNIIIDTETKETIH